MPSSSWGGRAMGIVTAISCINAAIFLVGLVKTSVNTLSHGSSGPNIDKSATKRLIRSTTSLRKLGMADETPFTSMILDRTKALRINIMKKNKKQHQSNDVDDPMSGDYRRLDKGVCAIAPPVVPIQPVQPTYTTSYPGSGDTQLYQLIEAMTGLVTGDDHRSNGHKNTVTINTHYPCPEGVAMRDVNVPRTVLLIRNPLDAISSYHSFMHLINAAGAVAPGDSPTYVSQQPPVEAWLDWRDNFFEGQLQLWVKHLEYWMELYPTSFNRLIISYENLQDEESGPDETARLAEFLSRSDGVADSLRPPDDLPCLWRTVFSKKTDSEHRPQAMEETIQRRRLQEKESLDPFIWDPASTQNTPSDGEFVPPAEPVKDIIDPNTPQNLSDFTVNETNAEYADATQVEASNVATTAAIPELIAESAPQPPRYDPPFTPSQFRDIALVLSQLLEKYSNERGLTPIIVGYMDDVQRRVQEQLGGLEGSQQFLNVGSQETQLVDGRHYVGSSTPQQQLP